jgi:hypothetical protein
MNSHFLPQYFFILIKIILTKQSLSYNKAMRLLTMLLIISTSSLAQNERLVRKFFSKDLFEKEKPLIPNISVASKDYLVDLNSDGESERINITKNEFEDKLQIFTNMGKRLFEQKFTAMGKESAIYKLRVRSISKSVRVIIVYYFEGIIDSTLYQSQTKTHFLTIENNDLTSIYSSKGSYIENEKGVLDISFYKKTLQLKFKDFNHDGRDEIIIGQKGLQRVFLYQGKGQWSQI